jgi:hypothetical protein
MRQIALIVLVVAIVVMSPNTYGGKIDITYAENTNSVSKRYYGKYNGSVKTEWLKDGRKMRLLKSITYIDPKGIKWIAPVGLEVDGTSIPQFFWSLVGGPYEGKYRDASVIHDAACFQKLRSWESVHEAFFNAMLASGVDLETALEFYAAVFHYGPRWNIEHKKKIPRSSAKDVVSKIKSEVALDSSIKVIEEGLPYQPGMVYMTVVVAPPKPQLQESDFAKLKALIEERTHSEGGPMSLEEIRNYRPTE